MHGYKSSLTRYHPVYLPLSPRRCHTCPTDWLHDVLVGRRKSQATDKEKLGEHCEVSRDEGVLQNV